MCVHGIGYNDGGGGNRCCPETCAIQASFGAPCLHGTGRALYNRFVHGRVSPIRRRLSYPYLRVHGIGVAKKPGANILTGPPQIDTTFVGGHRIIIGTKDLL